MQIYPITFGMVDRETIKEWKWFFRRLKLLIRKKKQNFVIVSYQNLVIKSTVNTVYNNETHYYFFYYHVKQYLITYYHNKTENNYFNQLLTLTMKMTLTRIYMTNEASKVMMKYLYKTEYSSWVRFKYPVPITRYNFMTSNNTKHMNSMLRHT